MIASPPAPDDGGLAKLIFFLIFFGLPLVARALRALSQKATGTGKATDSTRTSAERRAAQRRAEQAGEDLWRRLARGEEIAPRPAQAPAPAPAPSRVPVETGAREEVPTPLATLGEVSEPSEVRVTSLEVEEEPAPLSSLDAAPTAPRRVPQRPRLVGSDWRRAVIVAEILGTPVSERPGGGGWA